MPIIYGQVFGKKHSTDQPDPSSYKVCKKCNKAQPSKNYRTNNAKKDGLDTICRNCRLKEDQAKKDSLRVCAKCGVRKPKDQFKNGDVCGLCEMLQK